MNNRLMIAGDTHGNMAHWRYLIQTAAQQHMDRIFQVGDFGYWEHFADGAEFLNRLNMYASMFQVQVYFLDGNHDKTSMILDKYSDQVDDEGFLQVRAQIHYAPRGHRWTWNGTRFIALGGAYSVDKPERLEWEEKGNKPAGTYWFPEEEMTDEDMARFLTDPTPVDVMLAHDKPLQSSPLGFTGKDALDCLPNQHRLQLALTALRPSQFVHGHLHHRYSDTVESTRVQGLLCDPAATRWRPYRGEDSWLLLQMGE